MKAQPPSVEAMCQCGQTALACAGAPIASAVCYCSGCQAAGQALALLPSSVPTQTQDGGTAYCLYRKDRVSVLRGRDRLQVAALPPEAESPRIVATCCNTPMFLEMRGGHWLSVFRGRLAPPRPALELRNFTADRRPGDPLPDDLPNHPGIAPKLVRRLLWAWIAMGFRRPRLVA